MIPNTSTPSAASDAEFGEVDATALLVADHDEVKEMFAEYHELILGDGADAERADLVEQICLALTVHATLEEEIFYPAAREALGDPGRIENAEEEHASAKALIEQLQGMDPSEDLYDNTVQQLQEAVEEHVLDEEEELFVQVRASSADLFTLGMQMAERRDELLSEAGRVSADD